MLRRQRQQARNNPGGNTRDRSESLSENYEGCCGEGFCLWPRRRGQSIPAAGCNGRANAGQRQKTRRPEGFRAKGRLASLLLSRRSTRDILLRRASPSGLFPENSTPRSFPTGSEAGKLDEPLFLLELLQASHKFGRVPAAVARFLA